MQKRYDILFTNKGGIYMQKKKIKILRLLVLAIIILILLQTVLFAHSGRTDANGGHKDNKNKSGLGSYHYHCGGNPPHLHENGICPYKSSGSNNTSSSNSSKTNSSKSSNSSKSNSKEISAKSTQSVDTTKNTIKENTDIQVTSVQIKNKEKVKLKIGETLTLEANIEPNNATNKIITWSSNNTNIATVKSDGKVEALQEGTVKITAKSNNEKQDSIELTIEKPVIEVNRIVLDKNDISLNQGDTIKITELVYPVDATDKSVKWESSDEKIATVKDGKVTAINSGDVTITASSNNGIKSICNINVKSIKKENNDKENINSISAPAVLGALTITGGGAGIGYLAYKRKGK